MEKPLRVLIAEDNPMDAKLVLRELRHAGFEPDFKRVDSEAAFLSELHGNWDIILSDYAMPEFGGMRALKLLNESGLDIPFIIISGTIGEEEAVAAMKLGATDYLLKDRIARLGSAVERALEEKRLRAEQRRAEEQIRLQSGALAAAANGVLITDRAGRILWVNPAFTQLTGYTPEEAIGKTPRILKSDLQDAAFYRDFWKTLLSGQVWRGEFTNRHKDGSLIYDEHIVTPIRSEAGEITHFIGIMSDISERKRSMELEQRLSAIIEATSDMVGLADAQTNVIFLNSAGRRMFGLTDHAAARIVDYYSEETYKLISTVAIPAAIRTGSWEGEVALRHPDGHEIPVSQVILAHKNAAGEVAFLSTVCRDITERKKAELSLRDSEERFRQLAENITEVFWVVTPSYDQVLYISPAYEKIWGRTCDSLYQSPKAWIEAIHPEDRKEVEKAVSTNMQGLGDYDINYRILRPDGSIRWIRDRAFSVRNAADKVYRVVGTASDITETRNLEQQLRQSQKMEAFGLLAGGIAHDFNNLMSVVMGYSDIWLMKLPDDSPVREPLKTIKSAGERASNLTKQLLAFSRQTVLEPRVLDLNTVVRETEKMLARLIGEDVQLSSILNPAIPRIKVDPGQIGQVLINLAVNARDAMPRGGRLTIETRTVDFDGAYALAHPGSHPGRQVMLSVSDTGTGMPPETVARIFEPFFTTKGIGKGTGLGLAVVHGVVTQSGGSIQVESKVGVGTTFMLYFPITSEAARAANKSGEINIHAGIETILVVEDEESLCEIARQSLQAFGYTVLTAHSGAEALKLVNTNESTIDLMLADVIMPGMSGRELAETLKPKYPELKVLFMSGYTDDSVIRHGVNHEKVAFLQKPFAPFDLLKKVREVLDRA